MKHPDTAAIARAARDVAFMTQAAFAQTLDTSLRTIAEWEAGDKPPRGPARLLLLCIAARVITVDQLRKLPKADKGR